jgi:hypothetical protein
MGTCAMKKSKNRQVWGEGGNDVKSCNAKEM